MCTMERLTTAGSYLNSLVGLTSSCSDLGKMKNTLAI